MCVCVCVCEDSGNMIVLPGSLRTWRLTFSAGCSGLSEACDTPKLEMSAGHLLAEGVGSCAFLEAGIVKPTTNKL